MKKAMIVVSVLLLSVMVIANTGARIQMRNGDIIECEIGMESISFITDYGEFKIPVSFVREIVFPAPGNRVTTLNTVFPEETFGGFLLDEYVSISLLGNPIRFHKDAISKITVYNDRQAITQELVRVFLKTGDQFYGEMLSTVVKIQTSYGEFNISTEDIEGMEFEGEGNILTKIKLKNSSEMRGTIKDDFIVFKLLSGSELGVSPGKIKSIVFLKEVIAEVPDAKESEKEDTSTPVTSQTSEKSSTTTSTKAPENRPPDAPSNSNPSNDATNQPVILTLSWNCSDPDVDAIMYDVYFGTSSNPTTNVSTNQRGRTLNRSNLSYGTTYYWKVVAKDSKGATAEGPEWKFTTQSAPTTSSYTPSSIVPPIMLVEKGSFTMGNTWGGGDSNEKPTHKVTFTYDFYIGKYEVTFSEYDAFCNATGRVKPYDEGWGRGTRPVINVSWFDAIAYCNWLSEKENLPKAYDINGSLLDKDGRVTTDPSKVVGYRLPTEAEWEYVARGGNKSNGYKYSGSDNVDYVAWYNLNSDKTQEVGKKAPNELGIYDMSGNVWEWCSDWYHGYSSSSAQTNPYNSTAGSYRLSRGGSWTNHGRDIYVAYRNYLKHTKEYAYLGFRIARTAF